MYSIWLEMPLSLILLSFPNMVNLEVICKTYSPGAREPRGGKAARESFCTSIQVHLVQYREILRRLPPAGYARCRCQALIYAQLHTAQSSTDKNMRKMRDNHRNEEYNHVDSGQWTT